MPTTTTTTTNSSKKNPSAEYWKRRSDARMDEAVLQASNTAKEMNRYFLEAERNVKKEISNIFGNLAKMSTKQEAMRVLKLNPDKSALQLLRMMIDQEQDPDKKALMLTELSAPAYKWRIKRLEQTIENARKACNELYKTELKKMTSALGEIAEDSYYRLMYDAERGIGYVLDYSLFPKSQINEILRTTWSGAHYSTRLWINTAELADRVKQILTVGFMTGQSAAKMASELKMVHETAMYKYMRLIRTEANYVSNMAELQGYKELGIKEYMFVATLDSRTSEICQELDGQRFKVEEAQAGVNMAPMHPNCRSTKIMAEMVPEKRIAKDADGKNVKVKYMTYKEYKAQMLS